MFTPPAELGAVLAAFAPLFSSGAWPRVQLLVCGVLLAPAHNEHLTAALRVLGLAQAPGYQNFHRVLNRLDWSARAAARILLGQLVAAFAARGPLVVGIDETIERRRGAKISARAVYRDPARSSKGCLQKTHGLRWISLALLVSMPWAERVWALPFLSALCPSERYEPYVRAGRRHKPIVERARGLIGQVRRWLPARRPLLVVGDSSYCALELLAWCARPRRCGVIGLVTRLRLDAALYELPPARPAGAKATGRPAIRGARRATLAARLAADPRIPARALVAAPSDPARRKKPQPQPQPCESPAEAEAEAEAKAKSKKAPPVVPALVWERPRRPLAWYGGRRRRLALASETALWYHTGKPPVWVRWVLVRDLDAPERPVQALVSTLVDLSPAAIVSAFVRRWAMESTFHQARAYLGVERQRQWSDRAISRTTPVRLGLFSLVSLVAARQGTPPRPGQQAAWYTKPRPSFVDALAQVRRALWQWRAQALCSSVGEADVQEALAGWFSDLGEILCFAG